MNVTRAVDEILLYFWCGRRNTTVGSWVLLNTLVIGSGGGGEDSVKSEFKQSHILMHTPVYLRLFRYTNIARCSLRVWNLVADTEGERRLRVFENRVLRTVFGPKRNEVTREWRKLYYEELSDMYSLTNIVRVVKSRRMRWAGHVARMGEGRGVHRVLVGKPEGKRPLGRPRRRWEDYINP